jgi:mannose-6-phosphate isomerase-like protein (cupin superfamily)
MHRSLIAAFGLAAFATYAAAQTTPPPSTAKPAPPAAPPATAKPAAPRPAAPRPAAPAANTSLGFLVTDTTGAPLGDVQVTTQAPVAREGVTGPDGSLRFTGLRAGTYRIRFSHSGSISLERDVTLRAGESLSIDVALSAAPPAPKAPEPVKASEPESTKKELPPPGEWRVTAIPLFLEKNFIGRDPRKDTQLGCTPTATATLHQLREAWLSHTHDDADEWLYVVAGEGTVRIGNSDQRVSAGTFSLVPHTVPHAILPSGRNPLIAISILSGPACTK